MTTNTNCLEGIKCPDCGNEDRFFIAGETVFTVTDDGTEDHGDIAWDDDSYTRCPECDREGALKDFKAILVRFAHKPTCLGDVRAAANDPHARIYHAEVVATHEFSAAGYDEFTRSFLKDRAWPSGQGGWADRHTRRVIAVTAPDRQTLYVDPSGYSYARYVGMAVPVDSPAAASDPAKKPYSVLLLYPDYANDGGTETYYAFVEAPDPITAVAEARRQALAANDGVEIQPDDFAPLLVTEGHHFGQPTSND
jgi:hypothetical protein